LELTLKLRRHAAEFAHPLPERAQRARQFLWPDRDQRNNADDEEFAPTDVEHVNSKGRKAARRMDANPAAGAPCPCTLVSPAARMRLGLALADLAAVRRSAGGRRRPGRAR